MLKELEIRRATAADIPSVLKLYAQLDLDNGAILSNTEAIEIFKKFQIYPNYSLYIASIGDRIAGTFELLIMDNLAHKGTPSGIVEDVVVDMNYRSKGIGRKMMEFAIDTCKKNGCYKLTLSSSLQRENAHKFYEDLGFKKHGYSFLMEL